MLLEVRNIFKEKILEQNVFDTILICYSRLKC